jgi:uncharacterized protein (TIGR00369 family)
MPALVPRDPNWEARCRATFEKQPIVHTLGITLERLEPGFCEMRMPIRSDLGQQAGYLHAGIVATLADNAAGFAASTLIPVGADVLSVEFKINLMAPAKGELLIARARVLKFGRTLTVCSIDVSALDAGAESAVALMQLTGITLVP